MATPAPAAVATPATAASVTLAFQPTVAAPAVGHTADGTAKVAVSVVDAAGGGTTDTPPSLEDLVVVTTVALNTDCFTPFLVLHKADRPVGTATVSVEVPANDPVTPLGPMTLGARLALPA